MTTVRPVLLDADAFIHLRGLDLLELIADAVSGKAELALTEYVARHELSTLERILTPLEIAGKIVVYQLLKGTPEQLLYREYQQRVKRGEFDRRVDKGECEAVAWAASRPVGDAPVFVSCDGGARWLARKASIRSTDIFGLAAALVRSGAIASNDLEDRVSLWDTSASHCKPVGYEGFRFELAKRATAETDLFD